MTRPDLAVFGTSIPALEMSDLWLTTARLESHGDDPAITGELPEERALLSPPDGEERDLTRTGRVRPVIAGQMSGREIGVRQDTGPSASEVVPRYARAGAGASSSR